MIHLPCLATERAFCCEPFTLNFGNFHNSVIYIFFLVCCGITQEDAAGPSDPQVPGAKNAADLTTVRPKASAQLIELVQVSEWVTCALPVDGIFSGGAGSS